MSSIGSSKGERIIEHFNLDKSESQVYDLSITGGNHVR